MSGFERTETPRKTGKRDPEGRKRAIVNAAADLIASEGTRRITHRRVAERAGVSLGSTTQYFTSIDDLIRCGFEELRRRIDEDFDAMFESVTSKSGSTDAFVQAFNDYLTRTDEVNADVAFYAASMSDPAIRPLAREVIDAMVRRCEPHVGATRAQLLAVFLDGLAIETCLNGEPIDPEVVRIGVHALLAARDDPDLSAASA